MKEDTFMEKLMKQESIPDVPQSEDAYRSIRGYVIEAQGQVSVSK